jgi:nucleotide-binding universal stress UspA family protein
MKLQKILVPLDGSEIAESALPTAAELASESPGATLALIRAAEAHPMLVGDSVAAQVNAVREAEEYLKKVSDRLTSQGLKVTTSVWYGPAATSIVEAAKFGNADMIVMTSHGRSGIERLVLGSVAEHVLRGTTTPILLLRAAGAMVQPMEGKAERR